MTELNFVVPEGTENARLDRVLASLINDSSRSFLQNLIRKGAVKVDGQINTVPKTLISEGMILAVNFPEQKSFELLAEEFDFPILFEDSDLLVIDKPAGVVVHPACGNPDGTVVNALIGRYPGLLDEEDETGQRPGIVHRLDKDTSGCLAVALNGQAHYKLSEAFAGRQVRKRYLAIVSGSPEDSGCIETLIGRHSVHRQKMSVVERNGKNAITKFKVLKRGRWEGVKLALVLVEILTGRTHQIRVHMAHLKTPVLGDTLYGGRNPSLTAQRQLLHAWKLSIPHPVSGETLDLTAPLPDDFKRILCYWDEESPTNEVNSGF